MKVSEVITMLGSYDPNEELIIMWWDKEWATNFGETEVSDEAFLYANEEVEENEWVMSQVGDTITEAIARFYAEKESE